MSNIRVTAVPKALQSSVASLNTELQSLLDSKEELRTELEALQVDFFRLLQWKSIVKEATGNMTLLHSVAYQFNNFVDTSGLPYAEKPLGLTFDTNLITGNDGLVKHYPIPNSYLPDTLHLRDLLVVQLHSLQSSTAEWVVYIQLDVEGTAYELAIQASVGGVSLPTDEMTFMHAIASSNVPLLLPGKPQDVTYAVLPGKQPTHDTRVWLSSLPSTKSPHRTQTLSAVAAGPVVWNLGHTTITLDLSTAIITGFKVETTLEEASLQLGTFSVLSHPPNSHQHAFIYKPFQ